jgi:hypothetical protein
MLETCLDICWTTDEHGRQPRIAVLHFMGQRTIEQIKVMARKLAFVKGVAELMVVHDALIVVPAVDSWLHEDVDALLDEIASKAELDYVTRNEHLLPLVLAALGQHSAVRSQVSELGAPISVVAMER